MRLALLFVFAVFSVSAQTNLAASGQFPAAISNFTAETFQTQTNQGLSLVQRYQETRIECIQSRGARPKLYDYVNLEGFPVGQYTYTSVGSLQRTVRQFTTKLENATQWNFNQSQQQNAPPK